MHELVRLQNCTCTYRANKSPILSNINFSLVKGNRVLIGGASGTGKSTLLALLAGLIPEYIPARIDGTVSIAYTSRALVMQNPEAQIITPSVFEEVAFALENKNIPETHIVKKVKDMLNLAGLLDKKDRHPLTLSGGECQRVSLVAALAQEADVLFMDEPLSYLDAVSSASLVALLERGVSYDTAVIVEHRLEIFKYYCNRFFKINKGFIEECTFKELIKNHCIFSVQWFSQKNGGIANEHKEQITDTKIDNSKENIMLQPVLSVNAMSHSYGKNKDTLLFKDISFNVYSGTVAVIMGASGSGKTTILKKIAHILPVAPHEVILNGKTKYSVQYLRENCFIVPQNPEHMFIADTVLNELAAGYDKAIEYLKQFGLAGMEQRHPFSLSEGEKRRLNLCVAFALERKLIMFDEPTYGLDYESTRLLIQYFELLKQKGAALLVVTHDRGFAEAVGDTILILEHGVLHPLEKSTKKGHALHIKNNEQRILYNEEP